MHILFPMYYEYNKNIDEKMRATDVKLNYTEIPI